MSKQKKSKEEPFLVSLTPQERYELWFNRNYEAGMENNPEFPPDYNDPYYRYVPEEIKLEEYDELWYLYHRLCYQFQMSNTKRAVGVIAATKEQKLGKAEFFKELKQKLTLQQKK